jgi:hypothetical protein
VDFGPDGPGRTAQAPGAPFNGGLREGEWGDPLRGQRGSEPPTEDATPSSETANRDRAARRARGRLRRYAAANGLDRLIVLTYADQTADLRQVKRDTARFVKRGLMPLITSPGRGRPGGVQPKRRAPYVIGWERHKSGNWHINVLVRPYVAHERLERAWGRGYVWITRFQSKRGGSGRDAAREAAGYVAKYVAKEFADAPLDRTHRYEVGQGFQPREVRVYGTTARTLLWSVERETGATVRHLWTALRVGSDRSPPVLWAALTDAK